MSLLEALIALLIIGLLCAVLPISGVICLAAVILVLIAFLLGIRDRGRV